MKHFNTFKKAIYESKYEKVPLNQTYLVMSECCHIKPWSYSGQMLPLTSQLAFSTEINKTKNYMTDIKQKQS